MGSALSFNPKGSFGVCCLWHEHFVQRSVMTLTMQRYPELCGTLLDGLYH